MLKSSGAAQVFFEISIKNVTNLLKTTGLNNYLTVHFWNLGLLRIEWKRSSDDGKTKAVYAVDGVVTFNEKIDFKSNLFNDHNDLAKKLIVFHLKEKDV